jgi:hypothetical protein
MADFESEEISSPQSHRDTEETEIEWQFFSVTLWVQDFRRFPPATGTTPPSPLGTSETIDGKLAASED